MTQADIGLIGLGTMGAALALNIAEEGFAIAVFNRTAARTDRFIEGAGPLADLLIPSHTLEDFVASLRTPRAIILMVPAGDPVDQSIALLRPLLAPGDLIIDAGNANFHETNRRASEAGELAFMGIGVSGGFEGARHGPSIMGGGNRADWDRVAPILQAAAAKFDGQPCATWMGTGGAGHFVKTVHNGIEYADMQLIAESYGLMRDGLGMAASDIGAVFARWNEGPLQSYLTEISGKVAATEDAATGKPILDVILDQAGQKGTGRWTVIESQQIGAPVPVIEAAVAARNMSALRDTRTAGEALFGRGPQTLPKGALSLDDLEAALIAGKILCYAQGFELMNRAGQVYDWDLPMPDIAEVWRAGCIIRSAMLDDMSAALRDAPARNLMLAPHFAALLERYHPALRRVVACAVSNGVAVPALSAALGYFDTMRTGRGTANMIQGQRDFFGAHGFGRLDQDGQHHGPWVAG